MTDQRPVPPPVGTVLWQERGNVLRIVMLVRWKASPSDNAAGYYMEILSETGTILDTFLYDPAVAAIDAQDLSVPSSLVNHVRNNKWSRVVPL